MNAESTYLIEETKQALNQAADPRDIMALSGLLINLYRESGQNDHAIDTLKELLRSMDPDNTGSADVLASLYNNLGLLLESKNKTEAIAALKQADQWYRKLNTPPLARLAMVNYKLGQLYDEKGDGWHTKKYLKEAVSCFDQLNTENHFEALARAHLRLGEIYSDAIMHFDARTHYLKALKEYKALYKKEDRITAMIIGSLLNNIAITYQSLEYYNKAEEYFSATLEFYLELEDQGGEILPWIASTHTNLANLFAYRKQMEKAITESEKALEIYRQLNAGAPHLYRHYLATSLHNLGLHHTGTSPEKAKILLDEAIAIRKDLSEKQPEAFMADLTASVLNLVELIHSEWEDSLDEARSNRALELLALIAPFKDKLPPNLPSVANMQNDIDYYLEQFNTQDLEGLHFLKVIKEIIPLRQEVHATSDPEKKLPFQEDICRLLSNHTSRFPDHLRAREDLADALSDLSWFYLRCGKQKNAAEALVKLQQLQVRSTPESCCNSGHASLLEGDSTTALQFYRQALEHGKKGGDDPLEMLRKDLKVLVSDGLITEDPEKVLSQL